MIAERFLSFEHQQDMKKRQTYINRLPSAFSVLLLKLFIIFKDLNTVPFEFHHYLVCCDSESAQQTIQDIYSRNPLVENILCFIRISATLWILSSTQYLGVYRITGTTKPDEAAKSVANHTAC